MNSVVHQGRCFHGFLPHCQIERSACLFCCPRARSVIFNALNVEVRQLDYSHGRPDGLTKLVITGFELACWAMLHPPSRTGAVV